MMATTLLAIARRVRAVFPRPALGGEVLVVGYADVAGGAILPRLFARQITWLRRHFEFVPFSSLRDGRPGGRRPAAVVAFDSHRPAVIREALALLGRSGVPSVLFITAPLPGEADDRFTSWEELKALRADRLVELQGGAPPAADWRDLTPSEAAAQVVAAERVIEAHLGFRPDVFGAPTGFLPDAGWLVAFEGDPRLERYRAFVWTAPGINPVGFQRVRSRHWARWPAPHRFGLRERAAWKFPARIARYHGSTARIEPAGLATRASLTANPPVRQIAAFLTVVHPFRSHHHSREYMDYLYDRNPFRPEGVPAHYALARDGVVEAMLSAVGVPVREGGRVSSGVAISSWYRLPVVHHPLGAAPVVNAYLALPHTILSYDPSALARAAFEGRGWLHFGARWCLGPFPSRGKATTAAGRDLVESETPAGVAAALRRCWSRAAARFDYAVERTPELWEWKFASHPLGPHRFYAWLVDGEAGAVCALGWENERLFVSDFVYDPNLPDGDRELERFLATAFRRAAEVRAAREVCAETNQPSVLASLARLGVTPQRDTVLHWRPARGAAMPAAAVVYRSFADADFNLRPRL